VLSYLFLSICLNFLDLDFLEILLKYIYLGLKKLTVENLNIWAGEGSAAELWYYLLLGPLTLVA